MGRRRQRLDMHDQCKAVMERLKCEPAGVIRERLLAVSLGLKGDLSLQQIANQMGRSRATIQTWFDNYRERGISGLLPSKAPRGFSSALHERAQKELRKKLAKGSFRRAEDARIWLNRRFGIALSTNRVGVLLGKLGARLKVVRPRHPQSSEHKREHFRMQLARRMYSALRERHEGSSWKDKPVRVWIADEARFGLQPCLRRAWVTRGLRAHKNSRIRYQWQYIWSALEVDGSESVHLYTNKADTELSLHFLKQLGNSDPGSEHVVIWDGASFHPNLDHPELPENVTVLKQPSYSPELNSV